MVWAFIIGALSGITLTVLTAVISCGLDDDERK